MNNGPQSYIDRILAATDQMIAILDDGGCVLKANPALVAILNCDLSALLGKPLTDVVAPDYRPAVVSALAALRADPTTQQTVSHITLMGDTPRIIDMTASHLTDDDGRPQVLCVLHDRTNQLRNEARLRNSEQRLRTVVQNAPVFIFAIDSAYNMTFFEGQGTDEIHVEQVGGALGQSLFVHNTETADLDVAPPVKSAFQGEPASDTVRLDRFAFDIRYAPLKTSDGQVAEIIGIATDITQRVKAEESLRRYAEELKRSNAELQDFAYVASHDLQEPLRKIRAFGDRLQARSDSGLDDTSKDYLRRMQTAAERMQQLIEDLLAFSRVTTKAKPFQHVDLNKTLQGVISDLELQIDESKATITLPREPLSTIEAEPHQIRQLLQNLVGNALKYRKPDTPPQITITTKTLNEGLSPSVQLTFADNGIGFDNKYADRIFGLFQRLHPRHAYKGTGMGLAICRKIIERHNGTIHAEAVPDMGATFIITLPIKQENEGTIAHDES